MSNAAILSALKTFNGFASVVQLRAAGITDAQMLAADGDRVVCLKSAGYANLPASEVIVDGPHKFAYVTV